MKKILLLSLSILTLAAYSQTGKLSETAGTNPAPVSFANTKTYTSCGYLQESNGFEDGRVSATGFPMICADDFIIPAGECWDINEVIAPFFTSSVTGTAAIYITFYDDNAGSPGAIAGSFTASISDYTTTLQGNAFGYDIYAYDVNLSTPVSLCGGVSGTTYWVSVQMDNTVSGAAFYWEMATSVSTYGSNGKNASNTAGPWSLGGTDNFVFTLNHAVTNNLTLSECEGFSVTVGTNTYTSSIVVSETLVSSGGCDSIVNLDLTIIPGPSNAVTQTGVQLSADDITATYQWLDCNNAFAQIPSETNQTYTSAVNGDFAVEVTLNGCVDTSICSNIDYTGIEENQNNKVSAYPNPGSQTIYLSGLNQLTDLSLITISTVNGELVSVYSKPTSQLAIDTLASGVYVITLVHGNGIETIRFIKQ